MKKHRLTALILALCCLFSIAHAAENQPAFMFRLTWDGQPDSEILDIAAHVTGIMDDGGEVLPGESEGEYFSSSDSSWIGSHYIYGNGHTEISFRRLDGDFSIIVEWGNPDLLFSGLNYADINLNIEISTPDGILMNIAANPEAAAAQGRENIVPVDDYYCRGGTGMWYFGLRLDHGSILPLNGFASEPQEEIQYIQDVQSQSVEAYNESGFKTASEWIENGVVTAYTYWDYDENGNLVRIRYANAMDPDEVTIIFTHENGSVQMYNIAGTLLAEAASAYDAAEQLGMGYIVAESINGAG